MSMMDMEGAAHQHHTAYQAERVGRRGSEWANLIFAAVVFVVLVGGFIALSVLGR